MKAIAAAYNIMPWVYKRDYEGNIPKVPGREYYDNRREQVISSCVTHCVIFGSCASYPNPMKFHNCSMPAEGVNLNFVHSLQGIAEGGFTVDYVHGSRASRVVHPSSPGTAAVQGKMLQVN